MTSERENDDAQGRLWLADTLWRLGAIQFGDFSLGRTVRNSPVYVNAKLLISRPDALKRTVRLIQDELELGMAMRNRVVEPFDAIAGVPIGGLHIATALSLQMDRPLLYLRPARDPDEVLAPHVEGIYRPGQHVLVVDDLAAGGGSLVETIEGLRDAGLIVANAVVLIDREQGAARRLEAMGVRMHSILTLEVLLTYLHSAGHVNREDYDRSQGYLRREGEPRSEFD
ncbi:MAG: phosphoribosyltransferase [Dehalococcoidia bacterium]|nr:phosphoribosyltransferase [Dehalococcoidia bacterium]MCA9857134.1 phosphoribosyltransferase [Dehalococcoidia bacterium]MCB9483455.1 phosphoribosyltransferase [Dehalococcoidia bacterium]MCB9491540.1 phosphoribosyltransferase [Dehalococcoidia bacterium]